MTAILASYLTFTSKQSYYSKDRENTKILTLQEKKVLKILAQKNSQNKYILTKYYICYYNV